jgi:protein pelota
MEILWIDTDNDKFKVRVERDEDLWYLSDVIDDGDYVEGETQRKVDMGTDQKSKSVRKTFFLGINVESVTYDPSMKSFRASGKIVKCPDQVSKGRYHSFNVQNGDVITVQKPSLSTYHIKKLNDATSPPSDVLLVLVGRDTARFGHLVPNGYEVDRVIEGEAEKKAYDQEIEADFHATVSEHISDVVNREDYQTIVVASPGFWKENVTEHIPDALQSDIITASVSRVDNNGFNELLERPELQTALSEEKNRHESEIVRGLMKQIKQGQACYGWDTTKQKANIGAVDQLVVTESFLSDAKANGFFNDAEQVMKTVEQQGGDVVIISAEDISDRIDGLGGIAGVLRWKS